MPSFAGSRAACPPSTGARPSTPSSADIVARALLDLDVIRSRFPALASGAAFFDGPGGSQVPRQVIDAMTACLRDSNANLGGAFATSRASDEVIERGRAAAADFMGAEVEGIALGA